MTALATHLDCRRAKHDAIRVLRNLNAGGPWAKIGTEAALAEIDAARLASFCEPKIAHDLTVLADLIDAAFHA
jgi:hypothetical protein